MKSKANYTIQLALQIYTKQFQKDLKYKNPYKIHKKYNF